jgi:hypothetical protein
MEIHGTARQVTGDSVIRSIHIACWVTKITNTTLESVLLIAFQLQQWLLERVPLLRYYSIASLVFCSTVIYCHN